MWQDLALASDLAKSHLILSFYKHDLMRTPHCELWGIKRIGALSRNEVRFGESHILRLRVSSISLIGSSHRYPLHIYTYIHTLPVAEAPWWVVSFPRRRESRRRTPWGMAARLRGHDVLLVMTLVLDIRNGHLAKMKHSWVVRCNW